MEIRVPLRRACLAAGFLCGIGLGSAEAQQRTLTVATITPPSALDPHYHNTSNNNQALRQLFDSLVRFDNEGNLLPGLALSWRPLDALAISLGVDVVNEQPERWGGVVLQDGNLGRTDVLVGGSVAWLLGDHRAMLAVKVPVVQDIIGHDGQLSYPAIVFFSFEGAFQLE